jgi:hypothetical protein
LDDVRAALDSSDERTRRRVARALVGEYHEQQLRLLLERVRGGFRALDAGEIAPLDLDELIAHYSRAASKLEQFCGSSGSGWERAARVLVDSDEPGGVDWWEAAARSES